MGVMERQINFLRLRHMLCGSCDHQFVVDLEWIERWEQGCERCPGCGLTCEYKDSPEVTVDPADLVLDKARVAEVFWYHTSTHLDWPSQGYDPTEGLTAEHRLVMGGDRGVELWAASQRVKALHVGTYEAAVYNMLRRMRDQVDRQNQFYLYRVRLRLDVVVRDELLVDPGNWLGDVSLDDVCPPGVDVTRYLNLNEDPGGVSLALGRNAISSVQQVTLPVLGTQSGDWMHAAVAALEAASDEPVPMKDIFGRDRPGPSRRMGVAQERRDEVASGLPANLREQFESAISFSRGSDPLQWARRVAGLVVLIQDPQHILSALDASEHREI